MWVGGLRRSLARSAQASTNLVCRRRVLPTVKMGHSFAVARAFSGTALNMRENDARGAGASAETTHPAMVRAIEKEKNAKELLQLERENAKIADRILKEEKLKQERKQEKIEEETRQAEEAEVQELQEKIEIIEKTNLTPAEKEAKRAAFQEEIVAIRKAKAIKVKTLRESHPKAVAEAEAGRERATQRIAEQMEKVAEAKKERQDLVEELNSKHLKFPLRKPRNAFSNFMSIHLARQDGKPLSRAATTQRFAETVAKWYTMTKEEQALYTSDDYDAKLEDWKRKKAAWKDSLTPIQRALLKQPRVPGTYTSFTLFAKDNFVRATETSGQMKGISEKWHALTDAEIEDYRIRAAEIRKQARAAAGLDDE